jgi:hypothetical protein
MRNLLLAITSAGLLGIMTAACGSDSPERSAGPGVITVNGSERLAWTQAGDVAGLRFLAYVNDRAVDLASAACDGATPEATCSSPLPPLNNGVHSIALAAVDKLSGIESERSAVVVVQKVAGGTSSATAGSIASTSAGLTAARYAPGARLASLHLETGVSTSDGLVYETDTIAAGVKGPAQLAWAPDGRLFVAEADGRVSVIRPGERGASARERGDRDDGGGEPVHLALDARALLDPPPAGPMGIAFHPGFAQNHYVYVSFLAQDSRERAALRVIRLRDVGGMLGEAATIFEAPLAVDAVNGGPRLAFGPDGLLYVALPPGAQFDREPAASAPYASMVRLRDDGRVPLDLPALEGVPASPIGFDWHPTTGALWGVFPAEGGEAVLRTLAASGASVDAEAGRTTLRIAAGGGGESGRGRRAAGVLLFDRTPVGRDGSARAFVGLPGLDVLSVVTFAEPSRTDYLRGGMFGPISDLVAGGGGTLYLAAQGGETAAGASGASGGVLVRLSPRAR